MYMLIYITPQLDGGTFESSYPFTKVFTYFNPK